MAVDTLLSLDGYVGEEPVMAVMSVMEVVAGWSGSSSRWMCELGILL